jgi:hypothetical protein
MNLAGVCPECDGAACHIDNIDNIDNIDHIDHIDNIDHVNNIDMNNNEETNVSIPTTAIRLNDFPIDRAFTCDDGSRSEDVLCAKIPEIIEADYVNGGS